MATSVRESAFGTMFAGEAERLRKQRQRAMVRDGKGRSDEAPGAGFDSPGADGVTQLMLASEAGRLMQMQELIELGSDVNATDRAGLSVLDYASMRVAMGRRNKPALMLLQHGALLGTRCPACTLGVGEHNIGK
ncbi:hypothetical protein JKP88DRAFT_273043 [Tribonema minus]|uniref:Ankyrin repeat domain-containing protein n=1 Tax=Tribonema minus TaxID=303371 RepID=A0A836CEQ9_9STRA|nr:hypothetical protein JKP88DRAFT_273043 [Tribonema minus]